MEISQTYLQWLNERGVKGLNSTLTSANIVRIKKVSSYNIIKHELWKHGLFTFAIYHLYVQYIARGWTFYNESTTDKVNAGTVDFRSFLINLGTEIKETLGIEH